VNNRVTRLSVTLSHGNFPCFEQPTAPATHGIKLKKHIKAGVRNQARAKRGNVGRKPSVAKLFGRRRGLHWNVRTAFNSVGARTTFSLRERSCDTASEIS
jgi:hypothetical protein